MYFQNPELSALLDRAEVVVFDLNGLILDDEPLQLDVSNRALRQQGFETVITEENWITRCVGHKPMEWLPRILGTDVPDEILRAIIAEKDRLYRNDVGPMAHSLARPGILALFDALRQSDRMMAIASSTTRSGVMTIIGKAGLDVEKMFDVILCGDDVTRAKPDPEIYETVRKRCAPRTNFVVFEDSRTGILAAKAAAMTCIAVPNRFTAMQDLSPADIIISGFDAGIRWYTLTQGESLTEQFRRPHSLCACDGRLPDIPIGS